MKRSVLLVVFLIFTCFSILKAQDYLSNADLIGIKEQSEGRRLAWNKAFDEGVQNKDFSALPAARQAAESYIDGQLSALRRLYASGDGRELITAISNYLQIQKQFVKDIMRPAESLTPAQTDAIGQISQKINDFGSKEKVFLLEINNAIISSPEEEAPQPDVDQDAPENASPPSPPGKSKTKSKNDRSREKKQTPEEEDN